MTRILIVEDQSADLQVAAEAAKSLGASTVEARTSASAAKAYLQSLLEADEPLPDLLVVDLDLGYESGFELLRFWHSNPKMNATRVVVWTVMGEEQREICRLFKVNAIVSKTAGLAALRQAIQQLEPKPS